MRGNAWYRKIEPAAASFPSEVTVIDGRKMNLTNQVQYSSIKGRPFYLLSVKRTDGHCIHYT
jgi:hypothetical protein